MRAVQALLAAAEARHIAADATARFPGIATAAEPVDMPALVGGKQVLVESMRSEKYIDVADSYRFGRFDGATPPSWEHLRLRSLRSPLPTGRLRPSRPTST